MYSEQSFTSVGRIDPGRRAGTGRATEPLPLRLARALARHFRRRRDYRRLLGQPDYLLEDIGLTRDAVVAAMKQSPEQGRARATRLVYPRAL